MAIIGAIGSGLTYPAQTIVFGNLIGKLTTTSLIEENLQTLDELKSYMTGVINQSVLYMVYLFAIRVVCGYIATVSYLPNPRRCVLTNSILLQLGFNVMSIRVASSLRMAYLKAVLSHRVSMLDAQPPGQLAAILTGTANKMQVGISEKFALLIQSIALMIGAMVNAFYHSWKLTLVTSSGLLLIIITYCITTPFVVKNQKHVESMNIKASGVASEAFAAIKMIASCGAEMKMVKKYDGWVSQSRLRGMRLSKIVAVQKGIGMQISNPEEIILPSLTFF